MDNNKFTYYSHIQFQANSKIAVMMGDNDKQTKEKRKKNENQIY